MGGFWKARSEAIAADRGYRQDVRTPRERLAMSFGIQAILSLLVVGLSLEVMIHFPTLDGIGIGLFFGGGLWFGAVAISFFDEREAINIQTGVIARAETPVQNKAQPFPPVEFCRFIWSYYDAESKFPSIDSVIRGMAYQDSGINRALIQGWFQMLADAGALVGRKERVSAGLPAEGWDRQRMIAAAIDAATVGRE